VPSILLYPDSSLNTIIEESITADNHRHSMQERHCLPNVNDLSSLFCQSINQHFVARIDRGKETLTMEKHGCRFVKIWARPANPRSQWPNGLGSVLTITSMKLLKTMATSRTTRLENNVPVS
jgi:hypothetical protein